MKKLTALLLLTTIIVISLVSCVKKGNYTCTCNIKVGTTVDETYSYPYYGLTRGDADKNCKEAEALQQSSLSSSSPGSTVTCSLD